MPSRRKMMEATEQELWDERESAFSFSPVPFEASHS